MQWRLTAIVLSLLRVPPEPQAPAGSIEAVRIFRAAPNYFKLKLLRWTMRQAAGVIGLVVFVVFWDVALDDTRAFRFVAPIVALAEPAGILIFFAQMPVTYIMVRLDYELRWYIVTDRSLRIRAGLITINESTLTFANIQQITVRQGPLQRLLGISDLEVTTAGGGRGKHHREHGQAESMHTGYFHGIDNAPEVRDMMLQRLRNLRDTGLGNPDETSDAETTPALLDAARELLEETRALRRVAD